MELTRKFRSCEVVNGKEKVIIALIGIRKAQKVPSFEALHTNCGYICAILDILKKFLCEILRNFHQERGESDSLSQEN